jgi:hypothetical protein
MPVARPLALSNASGIRWTGPASPAVAAPNVSPPARPLRISTSRLEAIRRELTERDLQVLQFVADWRLATGAQLRRRFFAGNVHPPQTAARRARRALALLVEDRILERLPRRVGGLRAGSESFVYAVGRSGERLLATRSVARRLTTPGDRYVAHTLDVTELAVRLHEHHDRGELDLIAIEAEPACWRPFVGPGAARLVLKPDLFVRIGVGALEDRWFIEVDRGTEAAGTLTEKAKRYLMHLRSGAEQRDHGVYPRVLWTVPDDGRGDRVGSVMTRVGRDVPGLFTVCRFDEAVARLAAEART